MTVIPPAPPIPNPPGAVTLVVDQPGAVPPIDDTLRPGPPIVGRLAPETGIAVGLDTGPPEAVVPVATDMGLPGVGSAEGVPLVTVKVPVVVAVGAASAAVVVAGAAAVNWVVAAVPPVGSPVVAGADVVPVGVVVGEGVTCRAPRWRAALSAMIRIPGRSWAKAKPKDERRERPSSDSADKTACLRRRGARIRFNDQSMSLPFSSGHGARVSALRPITPADLPAVRRGWGGEMARPGIGAIFTAGRITLIIGTGRTILEGFSE